MLRFMAADAEKLAAGKYPKFERLCQLPTHWNDYRLPEK
jgi:hypothetical protein